MEATTQVKLYSLSPYRPLFPRAQVVDKTVKMGATVSDTVDFIPKIVKGTQWQVESFVNQELRGLSTYEACKKLWHFVKFHIRYKKDKRGVEQVRSPRRLIHDGVGDCDCFTTFIDTCLSVLKIPTINRITKYGESFFQHIYPIVPVGNGKYIIMDCVVGKFNYEEPYTEKKDYNMDLQYLDGIKETDDQNESGNFSGSVDAIDLLGLDGEIGDLGRKGNKANKAGKGGGAKRFFKKQKNMSASAQNDAESGGSGKKKKFGQRLREGGRKVLHVANRANPATVLLRAGILASMKLNLFKVAQNLKWAYLTPEQAQAKGADMSKFGKLKKILQKMEGIFFATGGKPENLRKSILTGKGNKNHEVNGLGLTQSSEMQYEGIGEFTAMEELLGTESYNSEFVEGLEGVEGLGSAVATGAAITSATTVMTAIAALIKSVGSIFPKKSKEAKDADGGEGGGGGDDSGGGSDEGGGGDSGESNNSGDENRNANNNSEENSGSADGSEKSNEDESENNSESQDENAENKTESSDENLPATTENEKEEDVSGLGAAASGIKAFWDNNKKWIKPVGISLTVVGAIWLGYKHFSKDKKGTKSKPKAKAALNGVGKKRKKKGSKKKSGGKKSAIALM